MGAFSANSVITVRCKKVMFSQVFVCPQVHGRRGGTVQPPWQADTPPTDSHYSGRYASYWNASLFNFAFAISAHIFSKFRNYRPLRKGNVFTGVCLSTGPRGGGGDCTTPGRQTPPPPLTDSHYSGRYASYWNAFLFNFAFAISAHIYR